MNEVLDFLKIEYMIRIVKGSVLVRVHGRLGTRTVKEKVESDSDPEPFRNWFLGSGTGAKTIYGTGPGLGRE